MRMPDLFLSFVAATLLMVPASAQDARNHSGKEAVTKPVNRVKELQQERIATLKT